MSTIIHIRGLNISKCNSHSALNAVLMNRDVAVVNLALTYTISASKAKDGLSEQLKNEHWPH